MTYPHNDTESSQETFTMTDQATPPTAPATAPAAGAPAGAAPAPASDMIPDGIYLGRVTSGMWGKSKNDKECCDLVCEILQEGPYKGRIMGNTLFFATEDNANRSVQALEYAGVDCSSQETILALKGLGSKQCQFVIEKEPQRPREDDPSKFYPERARIKWINGLGGGPNVRAMNAEEKGLFSSRLAGIVAKRAAATPATGAAGAPATPPASFDKF